MTHIMIDIESDGPIPAEYSMICFGAVIVDELLDKTEMEVNGRVSARSTGFSNVFSHDTVLEPQDCGGPLVNLDGKVVGINIARAGRVSSYALPSQTVKPIVDSLLAQAKLVSTPAKPAQSKLRPIR